jgi:glycosyltransferase involved in cell wall biosynthesis
MIPPQTHTAISGQPTVPPLVSVVIPCYNAAAFVSETIDSVLAQSYPNVEIVVIDDGSTDSTAAVLQGYRDKIVYRRKSNGGLASARNLGLKVAKGDLIALLDADDICLPGRLALQVECFAQIPELILCSSDFSAFVADRVVETSHIATYYRSVARTPGGLAAFYASRKPLSFVDGQTSGTGQVNVLFGTIYEQIIWGNFIHPPTVMVRRTVIDTVGEFDERIPNGTDYDWFIRVCRHGPAAYIDTPLLKYRYSDTQLSSSKNSEQISLDVIATLEKVRASDPELYLRHRFRFHRRIGACYLNAAEAALERDKPTAVKYLLSSMGHGALSLRSLKTIAKLLLSRGLLDKYRRHRKLSP